MPRRWTFIALAWIAASSAQAQAVRGRATYADSAGVPGVVVLLLDATGRVAARALTNERGDFMVAASSAGDYQLRTLRIGFRPATLPVIALAAGQEIERTITLHDVAFALDTIRVAERGRCAPYDSVSTVAAVWQQARTAFTAAQLTAGDRVLRASRVRHERAIDTKTRAQRTLATMQESGFVSRVWASLSADSLHRAGYVHQLPDGGHVWFAPDLEALLSDRFVQDHCFRLTREADGLGVRFAPARERSRVAEIEGTVWLDGRTSELRRMTYRYVNVPFAERGDPGGEMQFVRLANGGWAIERWSIRMPVFAERRAASDGVPGRAGGMERYHAETRITSGELTQVTRGSDTLWRSSSLMAARVDPAPAVLIQKEAAPEPVAAPTAPAAPSDAPTRDRSKVVKLEPVVATSVRLESEFEERMKLGAGHFLTRQDFDKHPARKLADFMAIVPGARIASADGQVFVTNARGVTTTLREPAATGRFAERGSRSACYVDVWLNGVQLYGRRADEALFDINSVSPEVIEGVEYYSSPTTTPIKYQRYGAECGALLIWLRKR